MENNNPLNGLREALKYSPDNVPLLELFAKACSDQWAFKEAEEAYTKILSLNPDHLQAGLGLAQIFYQTGSTSQAAVRLESILKQHPQCAQGWLLLAKVSISEGNRAAAGEHYHKAISIDPSMKDGAVEKELPCSGPATPTAAPQQDIAALNTTSGWVSAEQGSGAEASRFSDPIQDMELPKMSFRDVGGMENIKEEIRLKIIYPSQRPDIYKAYGKKAGGGVLLYGPPGCGKTLISRATAGEIKASFISIGLHQILDMYIGNSEKNLHEIFELARHNTPSILFVDEIDALAANRTDLKHSASRGLINQFLAEMDGDINSNEGVLILGATNTPWYIDPAFRRPGRFDRIIFVPTPDEEAREQIIGILAKDRPVSGLDAKALARKTKDFSGADLKSLFDLAIEASLAKAMTENRIIPLTMDDLLKQAKAITPSSRAWFESARNYALYSNQSGLYDPILSFLGIKK
jgi:transitional endoplasmic reticulum ATPase